MNSVPLLSLLAIFCFSIPQFAAALVSAAARSESDEESLQEFVEKKMRVEAFPYWNHVGSIGRSTGIYLGNGGVLTAAHVGVGDFRLPDGSVYQPVEDSEAFFTNRDGSTADLCFFKIEFKETDSIAALTGIPLTTMPPKLGNQIILLGAGLGSDSERAGTFTWNDEYQLRWGINEIEEIYSAPMPTHDYFSFGFATRFERGDHECQATPGDSGGAAFHYNPKAKRWELAGVIVAVDSEFGRAEFGNQTYIADPALFRRQLVALAGRLTPVSVAAARR